MPSNEDKFDDKSRHIRTISGRSFYLYDKGNEGIYLPDICHALSNICRFTGHVTRFYSVAEHSILVAHLVAQRTKDPRVILQALMHDSSEAYLADISSPFKGALKNYKKLENRTWKRIARAFGIRPNLHPLVKQADWIALFAEATVLQPDSRVHTWDFYPLYAIPARDQVRDKGIPKFTPEQAARKLEKEVMKYMLASTASENIPPQEYE